MYTKEQLKAQLAQMGIKPSDNVLIHTSFKAVGPVEGGPEAFIDAFCEYLTDGMFIVPTHTWSNVSRKQPVYDVKTSVPCTPPIPCGFTARALRNSLPEKNWRKVPRPWAFAGTDWRKSVQKFC